MICLYFKISDNLLLQLLLLLLQIFQTGFSLILRDSMSPKMFRALQNILAYFNSAAIWVLTILPLISSSLSLFTRFCGTVPRAPDPIGIIVNFIMLWNLSKCLRFDYTHKWYMHDVNYKLGKKTFAFYNPSRSPNRDQKTRYS